MKRLADLDSVGWGFFALAAAALSPLCIGAMWQAAVPGATMPERVALGVMLALILAAFLAWLVNEILYRRHLKKHSTEEKAEKRIKRKK